MLPDAAVFLDKISDAYLLGICSNTPNRHSSSVLPMLNIHERFQFFASSQDVGREKPDSQIFAEAFRQAQFWLPDLERDEVLHVGDSLACDFCGARAFGFQALLPAWKSNSGRPCSMAWSFQAINATLLP